MRDAKIAVAWSQTGLGFLSWIHAVFIFAWIIGAVVDGFNTGILHIAPAAYEILVIKILADSLGFGPAGQMGLKQRTVILSICMLVVAIALNITHLVFTAIELGDCESVLCISNAYWYLVSFAVLQGLLIVLEAIMVYFLVKYNWHLKALIFATNKK